MERGIIVLGMHRGGTSLVADLLYRWGAYPGPEQQLLSPDQNNLQGYWEHLPLIKFNQELLATMDSDWFVPPAEGDPALQQRAMDALQRQKALRLISTMEGVAGPWFWKDPRLALLLSFWKTLWGDAVYVIVIRHPLNVAMSLKKREHFPVSVSLLLWQRYFLDILRGTQDAAKRIFIHYENLLSDPLAQCRALSAFLQQHFEPVGDPSEILKRMTQRINPALQHHQNRLSLSDLPIATPDQVSLYSFLERITESPDEPFDESKFPLYAGWREYLQTTAALKLLGEQFRGKEHLLFSIFPPSYRNLFGLS